MDNVYHQGEIMVQQLVGEKNIALSNGRVITDSIIKGAINFIEKQPMAIVSSVDLQHRVWISLLIGDFGFVKVTNSNAITLNTDLICSPLKDVFYENIRATPALGTLFIELSSRRRFRLNGKTKMDGASIEVKVDTAYPNCPKYIQRRVISFLNEFKTTVAEHFEGSVLDENLKIWVKSADTFFVGSIDHQQHLDASHRGGSKGFVDIMEDGTLKIPDYQGNSMYNTLGNLIQNRNVGLLFVDFEKCRTLQLTGKGQLLFNQNSQEDLAKTNGTGRFWLFKTERWILTENHHNVNWEFLDYSPFNP